MSEETQMRIRRTTLDALRLAASEIAVSTREYPSSDTERVESLLKFFQDNKKLLPERQFTPA